MVKLFPITHKPVQLKVQEKARFFHQFAALLNAGISLERCLNLVGKDSASSFQRYLTKVGAAVKVGQYLASAMALETRYFDDWTISLIRLVEYGG